MKCKPCKNTFQNLITLKRTETNPSRKGEDGHDSALFGFLLKRNSHLKLNSKDDSLSHVFNMRFFFNTKVVEMYLTINITK